MPFHVLCFQMPADKAIAFKKYILYDIIGIRMGFQFRKGNAKYKGIIVFKIVFKLCFSIGTCLFSFPYLIIIRMKGGKVSKKKSRHTELFVQTAGLLKMYENDRYWLIKAGSHQSVFHPSTYALDYRTDGLL